MGLNSGFKGLKEERESKKTARKESIYVLRKP
jgi:hypothetical protein